MPNDLRADILEYIQDHDNAVAYEIKVARERGVHGIICCANGRFVAIEVRKGKNRPNKNQEAQVDRILEANGKAWFIRDFNKFKELFRQFYEGTWNGNAGQKRTDRG